MEKVKAISELRVAEHRQEMPKFPVIDMHTHFGRLLMGEEYEKTYDTATVAEAVRRAGIYKLVTLELEWEEGYERLLKKLEPAGDLVCAFGSVDISRALTPGFEGLTYKQLLHQRSLGSRGVKLWKNMTLYGEQYYGKNLKLTDPHFDCIYEACGELGLPIVIHVADPPCFFRPTDRTNEHYECLTMHPEWSFYRPGIASFEEHMEMQEEMIAAHPNTTFVVAHIGSYAENLTQVGAWLDAYPNMYIDIAARTDQLGRQPYTARDFMIKYQDRIMFGTDFEARFSTEWIAEFYHIHFRFLQTRDEYFEHPFSEMLGQWRIYGLDLPDGVLKKLYAANAQKIFGI